MYVRTTSPDRRPIGEIAIAPRGDADHAEVDCEVIPEERHPVVGNQARGDLLRSRSAVSDALMPRRPGGAPPADLGRQRDEQQTAEFISVPEWCRRVGCSRESGYRAARRDEIPGLFRIGRLKRVNWSVFVDAAAHVNVGNGTYEVEARTSGRNSRIPTLLPLRGGEAPTGLPG